MRVICGPRMSGLARISWKDPPHCQTPQRINHFRLGFSPNHRAIPSTLRETTMRHSYENVMEPTTGIEPVTPSLPRKCSTTEPRGLDSLIYSKRTAFTRSQLRPGTAVACHRKPLRPRDNGAGDGTRTRDPQLGRLMLYQLSYSRPMAYSLPTLIPNQLGLLDRLGRGGSGGEGRIRTSVDLWPADLQSAAFDRFATSPPFPRSGWFKPWAVLFGSGIFTLKMPLTGAGEGI